MTAQAGGASPLLARIRMAQRSRQVADERRRLRALRRALSGQERRAPSARSARRCAGWHARPAAGGSLVYLARDGEVDLAELIRAALAAAEHALRAAHHQPASPHDAFRPLLEDRRAPSATGTASTSRSTRPALGIAPGRLDVVLTPLVGFDRHGHRLGMGGGLLRPRAATAARRRRARGDGRAWSASRSPARRPTRSRRRLGRRRSTWS